MNAIKAKQITRKCRKIAKIKEKVDDLLFKIDTSIQFSKIMFKIRVASISGKDMIFFKGWITSDIKRKLMNLDYRIYESMNCYKIEW